MQCLCRIWLATCRWLSGALCRVQVHSWDYGPGQCCSRCGVADAFWADARPGREAIHIATQRRRYFPVGTSLGTDWQYVDNDPELEPDGDLEPD